jgi:hypothetical protein
MKSPGQYSRPAWYTGDETGEPWLLRRSTCRVGDIAATAGLDGQRSLANDIDNALMGHNAGAYPFGEARDAPQLLAGRRLKGDDGTEFIDDQLGGAAGDIHQHRRAPTAGPIPSLLYGLLVQ